MAQQTPATVHGIERTLAFVAGGVGVFSVLCFLALIIAGAVGVKEFSGGVWPAVETIPYIGFPIVILVIIALLIVSAVRRTREARAGQSK